MSSLNYTGYRYEILTVQREYHEGRVMHFHPAFENGVPTERSIEELKKTAYFVDLKYLDGK